MEQKTGGSERSRPQSRFSNLGGKSRLLGINKQDLSLPYWPKIVDLGRPILSTIEMLHVFDDLRKTENLAADGACDGEKTGLT